jgi:hypothetical protein
MARVQAGLLRDHGLIPGRGISRQYLQFMQPPPIKCVLCALSSGLIWPVHEANRLPPYSAEVTQLPRLPSCCAQGQLHLYHYFSFAFTR